MKNIIYLFIILTSCSLHKDRQSDNWKFINAYNYISNQYGSKVEVSDSIIDIDIVNFSEKIADYKKVNMGKVIDSLTAIQDDEKYDKYIYPLNKIINNSSTSSKYKAFFSKPRNKYIMVEVFEKEENNNYTDLTLFGSSKVFLFEFENGIISKSYEITLEYN